MSEKGHYEAIFTGGEGVFHSQVFAGFWLRVEWLWQEPMPPVDDILLEISGEEYAHRLVERLKERGWL